MDSSLQNLAAQGAVCTNLDEDPETRGLTIGKLFFYNMHHMLIHFADSGLTGGDVRLVYQDLSNIKPKPSPTDLHVRISEANNRGIEDPKLTKEEFELRKAELRKSR